MGQKTPFTVLNVLGNGLIDGRFVPDCLGVGSKHIDYYTDRDLTIGGKLNLFGREICIVDCDPYTREYYRTKYGLEDFSPVTDRPPINGARAVMSCEMSDRILPVFNGWGTHEDSEGNCKTIEPKQPKPDFYKFMHLDGMKLRFGGKLISKICANRERIFILTYYLSDDTISVFELAARNSGFVVTYFFIFFYFCVVETKLSL